MVKKKTSSVKQNPRFEFIPDEKWKKLTKEERSVLGSYKRTYGWMKKKEGELEDLKVEMNKKITKKKNEIDRYKFKLSELNSDIDHLRSTYNFTITFYNYNRTKNSKGVVTKYYMLSIGFRDNNKTKVNLPLGSKKKITDHILEHYRQTQRKTYFEMYEERLKDDWLKFIDRECKNKNGVIGSKVWDLVLEDPVKFKKGGYLPQMKPYLDYFFPLPKKTTK
tara:strand:- start:912 stop:1574 length:663 start_codon:yes stop_codon:yes gene_type:complete